LRKQRYQGMLAVLLPNDRLPQNHVPPRRRQLPERRNSSPNRILEKGMRTMQPVPQNDEQAIRELVQQWLDASKRHDLNTASRLMAEDVLFLVPGHEPFGKEVFAKASEEMQDSKLDAESRIEEIKVLGEWAWMHSFLKVTITPAGGSATVRSGHILTI